MVAWYRLEASSIPINIAEMKYVLLTDREQEHCTSPLRHYCDVRSPVYPMALSKLCVIALFLKDKERIAKNCNSIIEPNSVLPTASHIIDGLWFVAAQQVVTFTVVCPGKKKETVDIDPPIGMVKLNLSCMIYTYNNMIYTYEYSYTYILMKIL